MSVSPGLLPELHQLHLKLQEVRDELARGPRQIRIREQAVKNKRAEQEQLKEKLTALRKLADDKNLQLKTNESKIGELQAKLNAAATNKEYEIISTQIQADRTANEVLENEILEAFENVDQCQKQIAAGEEECKELEQQVEDVRREVEASHEGLEKQQAEIAAQLAEKEKELPPEVREPYRRLVQAHGAESLAAVENDACTSCYSIISPQERVQLNTHKILFCRSCGRLMYRIQGGT